jgi:hypothetical protein
VSDIKDIERRSAQAMLAMFVQVSSSVELARRVQLARERTLERRMNEAKDVAQITHLQHRLDALQTHSATIEQVSERLRGQAANVAKFAESGLTMDDFRELGVHRIVGEEELKTAMEKRAAEAAAVGEKGGAPEVKVAESPKPPKGEG